VATGFTTGHVSRGDGYRAPADLFTATMNPRTPRSRSVEQIAYQFASGAALSLGVVGIVHNGRDQWLGTALIVLAAALFLMGYVPAETARRREANELIQTIRDLTARLGPPPPGQQLEPPVQRSPQGRLRSQLRRIVGTSLAVAACVCAILVIIDAGKTPKSYASAYDGLDPSNSGCANSEVAVLAHVPLLGDRRQPIGVARLKWSRYCATIWVQIELTPVAEHDFVGRSVLMIVQRPADNASAPYPLPLLGTSRLGYGNQLAATACVEGSAQLLAGTGQPAGPIARLPCLLGPPNA